MRHVLGATAVGLIVLMGAATIGCTNEDGDEEHTGEEHSGEAGEGGEHGAPGGAGGEDEWCARSGSEEEGEEPGIRLAPDETHDDVRNGAHLILAYDEGSNSFKGTVENVSEGVLEQVRVEVHLSNGVELGPTTPTDLNPGESTEITLSAPSQGFDEWTAHPEVGEGGSGEHGSGEGEGEHGKKGGGKHN